MANLTAEYGLPPVHVKNLLGSVLAFSTDDRETEYGCRKGEALQAKKAVSEQSKHSHVKATFHFTDLCRSKAKATAATFQTPCIISFVKRNEATVFTLLIEFPFEDQTPTVSMLLLLLFFYLKKQMHFNVTEGRREHPLEGGNVRTDARFCVIMRRRLMNA